MKNFKLIYLIIFACCLCVQKSVSQDFSLPAQDCPNVPITFTNPAPSAPIHQWDFCLGDLTNPPTGVKISNAIPNTARPEGIEVVFDGTNWYGFITNRNSNSIVRVNYGNSLGNVTSYTNMGNISGALNGPMGIKFIKYNNNWHAVLVNVNVTTGNNGGLVRLDFGNDLGNNSPTATLITTTSLNFATDLDLHYDQTNNKYIAVVCNYGANLVIHDFGANLTNLTPTVTTTTNLPGSGLHSVAVQKDGSNWYGTTVSFSNPVTVNHLSFGTSLTNNPTVTNISGNFTSLTNAFDVLMLREGNTHYAMILTNIDGVEGKLNLLDFGSALSNQTPTFFDIGSLGIIGKTASSVGMAIGKDRSNWYAFIVNRTINANPNELIRVSFPNEGCNSSLLVSEANTNLNISFFNSGIFRAELITLDAQRRPLNYYYDQININASVVPDFDAKNICLGETTLFQNISIGSDSNVLSWEWDFGDSKTSNDKSPSHQYTAPGTYTVSLTPRTISGNCENAFTKVIKIREMPKASFTTSGELAATSSINFNNTSTIKETSKTSYMWLFDDGTFSLNKNPTHIFSKPGVYTVSLSVTDTTGGCTSVTNQVLKVGAIPEVDFQINGTACTKTPINFINTSNVSDDVGSQIVSYQWNFGGAGTSIEKNPTAIFNFNTTYEVSLTATTNLGVSKTVKKNINFQEGMQSLMDASVTSGEAPLAVNFTNNNTGAVSYQWSFGDGSNSIEANPKHVYTQPGIYTASLSAFSGNGCSIAATKKIVVSASNVVTEVALSGFEIRDRQLLVQVINNGNTPVTNLDIRAIFNKQDTLNLQWTGVINSLTTSTLVFTLNKGQGSVVREACIDILKVNGGQDARTSDNSICKNTLDVQVSSVIFQNNQYFITIKNNASVPVTKLDIVLDLGNQLFEKKWTGLINTGEQTSILGTLLITENEWNNSVFFCARINKVNDTIDAVQTNNAACQEYNDQFQILKLSPNPAIDFINVEYFLPQNQQNNIATLLVVNNIGKVMGKVQLLPLLAGRNTYQYKTFQLSSGTYLLIFIQGKRKIVRKIAIK